MDQANSVCGDGLLALCLMHLDTFMCIFLNGGRRLYSILINNASFHPGKANGDREVQYTTRTNKYVHFVGLEISSNSSPAPRQ
jgi:hypothetical protein